MTDRTEAGNGPGRGIDSDRQPADSDRVQLPVNGAYLGYGQDFFPFNAEMREEFTDGGKWRGPTEKSIFALWKILQARGQSLKDWNLVMKLSNDNGVAEQNELQPLVDSSHRVTVAETAAYLALARLSSQMIPLTHVLRGVYWNKASTRMRTDGAVLVVNGGQISLRGHSDIEVARGNGVREGLSTTDGGTEVTTGSGVLGEVGVYYDDLKIIRLPHQLLLQVQYFDRGGHRVEVIPISQELVWNLSRGLAPEVSPSLSDKGILALSRILKGFSDVIIENEQVLEAQVEVEAQHQADLAEQRAVALERIGPPARH